MPIIPPNIHMLPDDEKDVVLETLAEIMRNGKLPTDPAVIALMTLAGVRQLVGEVARTRNSLRNTQWILGTLWLLVAGLTYAFAVHGLTVP